jgi:hypothetical protein
MKLPNAILNGRLKKDGDSGDFKRTFVVANTNDGYQDLRIEIDTDDCDSKFAKQWRDRIIACVNACRGIEDLGTIQKAK